MTQPLPAFEYKRPKERRKYNRRCSRCGPDSLEVSRDELFVKRIQFVQLGNLGKVIRSRTVEWLCLDHMNQDADYQREAFQESPGFKNEITGGGPDATE